MPPRPRTRHLQVVWRCNGSCHQAPTDRAEADARSVLSSLPLALRWRVLAATTTHQTHACGFGFATEAAIKLRLIEQACGCSTVRGGGQLKVRALVSAAGTPVESACRHDHAPDTCCKRFDFATEAAIKLRLIEQACGCSMVRGGGRRKVRARLSTTGTLVESACRHDHAPDTCMRV